MIWKKLLKIMSLVERRTEKVGLMFVNGLRILLDRNIAWTYWQARFCFCRGEDLEQQLYGVHCRHSFLIFRIQDVEEWKSISPLIFGASRKWMAFKQ